MSSAADLGLFLLPLPPFPQQQAAGSLGSSGIRHIPSHGRAGREGAARGERVQDSHSVLRLAGKANLFLNSNPPANTRR